MPPRKHPFHISFVLDSSEADGALALGGERGESR